MNEGAIYVGQLYAFQLEGGQPQDCERVALGVDPELGLVQAPSRRELSAGEYMEPPARARGRKCVRLWYERSRKDFPGDKLWFHDLEDCRAFVTPALDKNNRSADRGVVARPMVILRGPDVETCPDPPGDFLCG